MTTRERTVGANRPFDLTWFIPVNRAISVSAGRAWSVHSFCNSSPRHTALSQVVIDKVAGPQGLEHARCVGVRPGGDLDLRGAVGWHARLVLAHTTNRIDVELGARMFRHLVSLPLGYFGGAEWVIGGPVRELENIRQFLTGQT